MCAKPRQILSKLMPKGTAKEALKSAYYKFYYNAKHFGENDFHVYYEDGSFRYVFAEGVAFRSYENIADELKRSLRGYLKKYLLKTGDTVVDCGAYIGEFALYAAKVVGPDGRVIAFEPGPGIYKRLVANIELNGLKNITAVNKGLWSTDGVLKFAGDNRGGYSSALDGNPAGTIYMPVVSLDKELARLGIGRVDFIKADVEGSELELVKGAEKTLGSCGVNLAIASYHIVGGKKTCLRLEKMLALLGYMATTNHPGHITTYASPI